MNKPITFNAFATETNILSRIAFPLIIGGIVETSVGFFSTLFLAHLNIESLAAGALVNWLFTTLMVIFWGSLSAVSVLIARHVGAKNFQEISYVLYAGLFIACLLVIPSMFIFWNIAPILIFFGQKPAVVALAQAYLHGLTWAIIPDFLVTILLHFVSGLGKTRTNLIFSLIWVPLNIGLNYLFLFGKLKILNLGIAGIGWGMSISLWITSIFFLSFLLSHPNYRYYFFIPWDKKIFSSVRQIIHVGLPLGIMYSLELGYFFAISLIIGRISQDILSANQITAQFFWIFSIVTFCIAQAITIRTGHIIGSKEYKLIFLSGVVGVSFSIGFMCLVAFIFWFLPNQLINFDFDLKNPVNHFVIISAKKLLAIAALVQIVEACRFGVFGLLRAFKDTRFTMWSSFFIYWIISLPIGYLLAIPGKMAATGIWCGMLIGQLIGAPALILRYRYIIKKQRI